MTSYLAVVSVNLPLRVTESSTVFEFSRVHKCSDVELVFGLSNFWRKCHFGLRCFKLGKAREKCILNINWYQTVTSVFLLGIYYADLYLSDSIFFATGWVLIDTGCEVLFPLQWSEVVPLLVAKVLSIECQGKDVVVLIYLYSDPIEYLIWSEFLSTSVPVRVLDFWFSSAKQEILFLIAHISFSIWEVENFIEISELKF